MTPDYVFRQYDVRGIAYKELNAEFYEKLGKAYGAFLFEKFPKPSCAVGMDVRESSPAFHEAFVRGILSTGCDVIDIGEVSTPMAYFAIEHLQVSASAAITASHNPPEYNGAKFRYREDGTLKPVTGIAMKEHYKKESFPKGSGKLSKADIEKEYIKAVVQGIKLAKPLNVVVDGGNGIAGKYAVKTAESLGCSVTPIFCTPGTMEAHLANPSKPENYPWLIEEVKKQNADLGLMVDGDGDRLGAVTRDGEIIWSDMLLLLFARESLAKKKPQNIIVEVKCSQALVEDVKAHGGKPIFCPTGYTNIEKFMHEHRATVSGEMSGHFYFFEEKEWFSDANHALAKLLRIVSNSKGLKELLSDAPTYHSTPEYRIHVNGADGEKKKVEIVNGLVTAFKKEREVIDIDGGRVLFPEGWGLIRYSNNEPELSLRFEAKTPKALEEIREEFKKKLSHYKEITVEF